MEDLLTWTRRLDDRQSKLADRRRCPAAQGLIPAMADGPRRDAVIDTGSRILAASITEARHLSNLSLHVQSSRAGSPRAEIRDGRMVVPFPDRVARPVNHRWQPTYNEGRDAATVADEIMESVERFMDDLIAAFENHLPSRFRKTGPVTAAASPAT